MSTDMPNSGPITSEGLPHTASVSDGKDSSRGGPARDSGPVDVDAIEARALDMSVGFAQLGEDHGALIWEVRRLRARDAAWQEVAAYREHGQDCRVLDAWDDPCNCGLRAAIDALNKLSDVQGEAQ